MNTVVSDKCITNVQGLETSQCAEGEENWCRCTLSVQDVRYDL
jgi:hypothetical protein